MFNSSELREELQSLKSDTSRLFDSGSEIHGASVDALQLEARTLQAQVSGMIHHPLNGVLPTLIVRLITIIIRSVKKPAAAAAAHSTQGSRD